MKKRTLLTVLCSVVCAIATLCFFGNVKTTARAETVSEVTIDWRGSYEGSTTMDYFYLGFAGFNTKDDYGGVAVSDYVFQNVKLNGVSFFEINSNTDVTDWVWDTFPQNQDHMPEHKKPILGYSKEADRARLQFRIHKNVTDEFLARDGYLRITVCDGFTLNGYVVDGETTFAYNGSTFEKVVPSVDFTANLSTHDWIKQSELNVTYLEVGEGVMPTGIAYGFIDAAYIYAQEYILINGRSVKEINEDTTLGAKDWTYTVFPATASDTYKIPVILFGKETSIEIKIHDEYLKLLDGKVEITAKAGLYFENNGKKYENSTDKTFTVWQEKKENVDITDNLSTHDWIKQSELNVTYLEVGEGVMPAGIAYGFIDAGYTYAQEYILINGRSVKEINEDMTLGAKDWTYTVFPSTLGDVYKIPVMLCGKETSIEIKIHDEYLKLLGSRVEITAKAGLSFENGGVTYETTEDKTFTVWEQVVIVENDITESVSINGWHTAGNSGELSYAIISFEQGILSGDINYGIIDNPKYQYLQEYITVNGKTVAEINTQTDTSSYEFSTFPSTTGAPFNVPVVIFENGDTLEIKVHNDYIASLGGNVDVTIGIKAGAYFAESETVKNVVKSDVQELVRRKEYTLTLINGDSRAEISLAHGSAINLEDQARAGYTFEGWLEYETDSAVLATMPERDYTVYAVYTAIEYTVTFVADGETVATKTYTVENLAVEEPAVPEKAHYTGAWEEYTLTTGNVTVNAIYTAIEYTVTFVAGEETVATKTYTVENVQIEEPAVPEKEGYTSVWEEYTLDLNNLTVTAIYTIIEYTVTFVADGETVATKTYTVENVQIEEPAVPEKEGYTGVWEEYELDFSDITVEAVYTAVEQQESEFESEAESIVEGAPNSQQTPETASKGGSGCMGSIGGSAIGLLGLVGVLFVRKKKD